MAEITFNFTGSVRDERGHFARALDVGLDEAFDEMARDGMEISSELAPTGHKRDPRTVTIREGMYHEHTPKSASWGSTARHAAYQERGAKRHPITGQVSFFWEREGRRWRPGPNLIDHPGNPATHYLRDARDIIAEKWPEYVRRHLKGRLG